MKPRASDFTPCFALKSTQINETHMRRFGFDTNLDKGARRGLAHGNGSVPSFGVVGFNNMQDVNKTKQSHSSRTGSKGKQPTCRSYSVLMRAQEEQSCCISFVFESVPECLHALDTAPPPRSSVAAALFTTAVALT